MFMEHQDVLCWRKTRDCPSDGAECLRHVRSVVHGRSDRGTEILSRTGPLDPGEECNLLGVAAKRLLYVCRLKLSRMTCVVSEYFHVCSVGNACQ